MIPENTNGELLQTEGGGSDLRIFQCALTD